MTDFIILSVSVTTPYSQHTMPLVVPGLMSNDKDKTSHWRNQLMGKKLGDISDETVSQPTYTVWHTIPLLMSFS